MKGLSKAKQVIYSLLLLTVFWSSLFIVSLLNTSSESSLVNHLPSGVNTVVKINNRHILKRFIFDALYSSELNKNEFDQLKFSKSDVEMPHSGIKLTEDIYIFQDSWRNQNITGFLFNISNKDEFSEFQSDRKHIIKTFNDDVGCILMVPKDSPQESLDYFELYAADILIPNKDKLKAEIALKDTDKESLLHLFFAGSSEAYVQDLSLEASIKKSTIHFEGVGLKNPTISYDSVTHHSMDLPKEKLFLEVQAGQLPDSVYGYIDDLLKEFNLKLPHINSQQLLIYGFMIDNIEGSTAFLPKFDGVFRFNSSVDIIEQVDSLSSSDRKVKRIAPNKIRIGEIDYYFKQITDKEILIGVTENVKINKVEGAPLPRLRGNPGATLMIEGKGIIAQFAQMLPPVQYSKKLFNDLEYFDIHTELISQDELRVTGEMRFADDKTASIELIKFLMKF